MNRDMFYFADLDFKSLEHLSTVRGLEDSCLVLCEQMLEKVLKGLLKLRDGEYPNKHNLKLLLREYDKEKKFKSYSSLCGDLTDSYFNRRYETDEYYEYTREEYLEIINKSIELYSVLLTEKPIEHSIGNMRSF